MGKFEADGKFFHPIVYLEEVGYCLRGGHQLTVPGGGGFVVH